MPQTQQYSSNMTYYQEISRFSLQTAIPFMVIFYVPRHYFSTLIEEKTPNHIQIKIWKDLLLVFY